MKRWWAVMCLGWAVGATAAPLSMEDAWQRLLAEDEQLAAGAAAQQRAASMVDAHVSLLLPQIDLVGSVTHLEHPVELDALALDPLQRLADTPVGQALVNYVGGEDWFVTPVTRRNVVRSSLVALWPLYTGGKIKAAGELARLGQEEARALLAEMQRLRFVSLVAAYYGAVSADRVTDTLDTTANTLDEHARGARAREAQQQLAPVERMAIEVAYEEAALNARSAAQKRDNVLVALRSMVHEDGIVEPVSPLFIHRDVPPLAQLLAGLDDHPALAVLAAKRGQAQTLARASRGQYHPNVFLYGSHQVYQNNDFAKELTPDWYVGLGVRMPLLDRSGRRHTTQAADAAVDEAGHLYNATRRKLAVLLERQHNEVTQALSQFDSLAHSIGLAEEALHLQQRAFAEGLSRSIDVLDAQNAVTAARTRQQLAATRYVLALSELLTLAGRQDLFFEFMREGEPVL